MKGGLETNVPRRCPARSLTPSTPPYLSVTTRMVMIMKMSADCLQFGHSTRIASKRMIFASAPGGVLMIGAVFSRL